MRGLYKTIVGVAALAASFLIAGCATSTRNASRDTGQSHLTPGEPKKETETNGVVSPVHSGEMGLGIPVLQRVPLFGFLFRTRAVVTEPQAPTFTIHTVKTGDSLASLAAQYSVTKDAIVAANPSIPRAGIFKDHFANLPVGQEIKIPVKQIK